MKEHETLEGQTLIKKTEDALKNNCSRCKRPGTASSAPGYFHCDSCNIMTYNPHKLSDGE